MPNLLQDYDKEVNAPTLQDSFWRKTICLPFVWLSLQSIKQSKLAYSKISQLTAPFLCGNDFIFLALRLRHWTVLFQQLEKPYACNLCNFRSARLGNLTVHMRTHTGEKPYVCQLCPYRSNHLSNLKQHHRHKHNNHFQSSSVDF